MNKCLGKWWAWWPKWAFLQSLELCMLTGSMKRHISWSNSVTHCIRVCTVDDPYHIMDDSIFIIGYIFYCIGYSLLRDVYLEPIADLWSIKYFTLWHQLTQFSQILQRLSRHTIETQLMSNCIMSLFNYLEGKKLSALLMVSCISFEKTCPKLSTGPRFNKVCHEDAKSPSSMIEWANADFLIYLLHLEVFLLVVLCYS